MSNIVRNHKDNVFCLLYREKKNLLSLYNAINGTSYENEEELEVVTLEEAICLKIRNDAAFVIDSTLNLCEQQASVNPNMALRDLYYVTEELKKIAPPKWLYHRKKVKIPAPRFIVFYNGVEKQPERQIYRLSDLFEREEKEPELELRVTVININPGYNMALMEKCESLRGYMIFVKKARDKKDAGIKLEEAVRQAVEECISEDILTEFFTGHREEIVEMGIYEFDQELHDRILQEDSMEMGIELGKKQGIELGKITLVCKKMKKNKTMKEIAEDLEEDISDIEPIYNTAKEFAPEYSPDLVFEKMNLKRGFS